MRILDSLLQEEAFKFLRRELSDLRAWCEELKSRCYRLGPRVYDDDRPWLFSTLTEWKRVTKPKDLPDHIAKARSQAAKYASGILGGVELRSYRYLVFVSETDLPMPEDIKDNAIVYRHINIPITPKSPSKA